MKASEFDGVLKRVYYGSRPLKPLWQYRVGDPVKKRCEGGEKGLVISRHVSTVRIRWESGTVNDYEDGDEGHIEACQ